MDRFEREARERFPDLSDAEIAKRADSLKSAYFARLAYSSALARRKKTGKR